MLYCCISHWSPLDVSKAPHLPAATAASAGLNTEVAGKQTPPSGWRETLELYIQHHTHTHTHAHTHTHTHTHTRTHTHTHRRGLRSWAWNILMRKLMFTLRKLYSLWLSLKHTHTHTHTAGWNADAAICLWLPLHTGSALEVSERLQAADRLEVERLKSDQRRSPVWFLCGILQFHVVPRESQSFVFMVCKITTETLQSANVHKSEEEEQEKINPDSN